MGDTQTRPGRVYWMSCESMLADAQQDTGSGSRRGPFQALLQAP